MKVTPLLFILASSVAFVAANPELVDVHKTGLSLAKVGRDGNVNHFMVNVVRQDDLIDVDDKDHHVKGIALTKVTQVQLSFDVSPTGEVMCNNMPVPLGVSTVKVKTNVAAILNANVVSAYSPDQVMKAMEEGIVAVRLQVTGAQMTVPNSNVVVQRIIIQETVLEVNGNKVEQSEAVQQVLDIHPDGEVVKHEPVPVKGDVAVKGDAKNEEVRHTVQPESDCDQPTVQSKAAALTESAKQSVQHAARWFHHQPSFFKIACAFMMGGLMGLVSLALLRVVMLVFAGFTRGYRRCCDCESGPKEDEYLSKVDLKGKMADDDESDDELLPAYSANGYAAVHRE